MLNPVALQGTEVISVAQFAEQLLEDRPVAIAAGGPELAFQMPLEVGLNVVVIEQRVVHIDEEHGRVGCDHKENSSKYRIRQPGASSHVHRSYGTGQGFAFRVSGPCCARPGDLIVSWVDRPDRITLLTSRYDLYVTGLV